ncbi:histidine phosphatase family protein [uncultured Eubacterium sp.]|uniref:histidine phosphatase family protein n=1 Tax=Eubacterium sp. TaxID=142586 RepID=UPI00267116F5|nr:histidine phosphatase family protein [uncultured Eubacterium sp.]
MNIYLIRHGRQCSKLCNVDVELAPEGREQADLLGQRLKTYDIEAVYSSDLIRARETADIINKHLNKPRVIDERWQEANFGGMTGLTNEEMREKYGDFLEKRATMMEDIPYPDGGENCRMVFERSFEALKDLTKENYENVCVVTHGGVIRALLTGIVGADYAKWLTYGRQLENCSISHILYDEKMKTFHIERLNDFAHFEGKDYLMRKHFGTGFFRMKKEK